MNRYSWKMGLKEEREVNIRQDPTNLPAKLTSESPEAKDFEYRKVFVLGEFDHSKEMFVGEYNLLNIMSCRATMMS